MEREGEGGKTVFSGVTLLEVDRIPGIRFEKEGEVREAAGEKIGRGTAGKKRSALQTGSETNHPSVSHPVLRRLKKHWGRVLEKLRGPR